jgi:heme-degrading monooxygenase HmoA
MFARITTFRLKPGAMDDLIRAFQDWLALTAAEQPGFSGITLLTDARTGKAITIGLWATEADLLAGQRSGGEQEQFAKLDILLAELPAHEIYEVSVQVELTAQGRAHIRGI